MHGAKAVQAVSGLVLRLLLTHLHRVRAYLKVMATA